MTSRRQETWLFAALIAVHLLPIWLLPMAPTQDGPAHLSMAHALRQYDAPEGSYLREYFVRNPDAVPTNWFVFAYLTDILTVAPHVEPRRTLLTLSFSNAGEDEDGSGDDLTFRTWPFVHAGSHLAARVPLVDLALYEGHDNYFPLTYRPERDPYLHLVREPLDLEAQPPRVDLSRYPGRIDYVLLIWPDAPDASSGDVRRQLADGYERVHRSPEGLAELWRHR